MIKSIKNIVTVSALTLLVSGCSSSDIKKATEEFIEDNKSLNVTNNSSMVNELKEELTEVKGVFLDDIFTSLDVEDDLEISKLKGYNELKDKILSLQNKLDFKLKDIKFDETRKNAELIVSTTYVDIGDLLTENLHLMLDKNIIRNSATSGKLTNKEFYEESIKVLNESLDNLVAENNIKTEKQVKLSVVKDGDKWKVSKLDKKARNSLSLGFYSHINKELDSKLTEVSENGLFLEIESSLKSIVENVQVIIEGSEDITVSNFHEYEEDIKEKLAENTESKLAIGEVVDEEGVYQVLKGDTDNEIAVIVNYEGQDYKLSREVEVE